MQIVYKGQRPKGPGQGINEPKEYLSHKDALEDAAELDKLDIFAGVNVVSSEYESEGKGAGIVRDEDIHMGGPVIFDHQASAAEYFLKNLRGIGILADEVGMGKTFEAGIVLSELAKFSLIDSLLIVATNIADWQKVMAMFGLTDIEDITDAVSGKNDGAWKKLFKAGVPQKPFIISMDAFRDYGKEYLQAYRFDALVVDEAHQLMDSGWAAVNALMKKKINKPYCILVSGTPHKGRLEEMFPLWYFAQTKGLDAEKFDSSGKNIRPEYAAALEYFTGHVCRGAKTIAEFVDNSWARALDDKTGKPAHVRAYREYLDGYKKELKENTTKELTPYELREAFGVKYPAIYNEIRESISSDYNDNLIGSCMKRQSRSLLEKNKRYKKKNAINYYFVPATVSKDACELRLADDMRTDRECGAVNFTLDATDFYGGGAVKRQGRQKSESLMDFMKSVYDPKVLRDVMGHDENTAAFHYKAQAVRAVFEVLRRSEADFGKKGGLRFYRDTFIKYTCRDKLIDDRVVVAAPNADPFEVKAEQFVRLVNEREGRRVIVFFDADRNYQDGLNVVSEPERLYQWLKDNAPEVFARTVFFGADSDNEEQQRIEAARRAYDRFYSAEDSVLFATPPLDESFNFQKGCATVINFSVSPDPVKTDQSIGRVDRIGQTQNIEIVSMAFMNELEGYLLAFYNRIKMFSDWQSDIIIAAGCNSETAIKQCREPDCERIVMWLEGGSERCGKCGGRLGSLKAGLSYKCDNAACGYILKRVRSRDKVHNFAYMCDNGEKLCQPDAKKEIFMCDKGCAVSRCDELKNCEIKRLRSKGIRCKDELSICRICKRQGLNTRCNYCSVEYDIYGNGDGEKVNGGCAKCSHHNCRLIKVDFSENKALCPRCGKGRLIPREQKSFKGFVNQIWNFVTDESDGGHENFVDNFGGETDKVWTIIETLTKVSEPEEAAYE